MKDIFDTLIVSSQILSEEELINFILNGLNPEFEPMVTHMIARMESSIEKLTLAEVKSILQKYEQRSISALALPFEYSIGVLT